jgi:hypothetical protein
MAGMRGTVTQHSALSSAKCTAVLSQLLFSNWIGWIWVAVGLAVSRKDFETMATLMNGCH